MDSRKCISNCLCLSIDGLQSGMIGAFGNTWIHTPTLDALACQSALFDRFYASTLDLPTTLAEWWNFPATMTQDCHKILLTDDADVFLHEHAGLFDEKHRLESKRRNRPARRLEETQFCRNMATIADLLRNRNTTNFLLWAHLEGFRGTWDFPHSYRQRYQIDDDPAPYPGTVPPEIVNERIDPDTLHAVREAYSGGVSVLDEALSGLLEFLSEAGLDQSTMLLFTSVRGFSLGEHNKIGVNEELYGENVHLPLFIRFPDGSFSGFRSQTLLQPGDVFSLLAKEYLPEEPDEVHQFLRIAEKVTVTPDWFVYQKPYGDELYVKPDDRWEVNDVSARCPHILEQIGEAAG